jgi:Transmembrane family 220, helix
MQLVKKIFNGFMILFFLASAILQYNDPDPYIWMPIYLAGAWLSYQAIVNRYNSWWYLACTVIFAAYAGFLFFNTDGVLSWFREHDTDNLVQTMKAKKPWIEQTREFGGLAILLLTMLINWTVFRKKRSA